MADYNTEAFMRMFQQQGEGQALPPPLSPEAMNTLMASGRGPRRAGQAPPPVQRLPHGGQVPVPDASPRYGDAPPPAQPQYFPVVPQPLGQVPAVQQGQPGQQQPMFPPANPNAPQGRSPLPQGYGQPAPASYDPTNPMSLYGQPPMPVNSPVPAPVPPELQAGWQAQPLPEGMTPNYGGAPPMGGGGPGPAVGSPAVYPQGGPRPAQAQQANAALTSPAPAGPPLPQGPALPPMTPQQFQAFAASVGQTMMSGFGAAGGAPGAMGAANVGAAANAADLGENLTPNHMMQITNGPHTTSYGFTPAGIINLGARSSGREQPSGSVVTGNGAGYPGGAGGAGPGGMAGNDPAVMALARGIQTGLGGMPTPEALTQAMQIIGPSMQGRAALTNAGSTALEAGARYSPGGLAYQAENRLTAQAEHGMSQNRVMEGLLGQLPAMMAIPGMTEARAQDVIRMAFQGMQGLPQQTIRPSSFGGGGSGSTTAPSPVSGNQPQAGANWINQPRREPPAYQQHEDILNRAAQMGPRTPLTPGQRPTTSDLTPGVTLQAFLANLQQSQADLLGRDFPAVQAFITANFSPQEIAAVSRGMPGGQPPMGQQWGDSLLLPGLALRGFRGLHQMLGDPGAAMSPEEIAQAAYRNSLNANPALRPPGFVPDR